MQMEYTKEKATVKVGTSRPAKFEIERGVSSNYLICLEYAVIILAPLLFVFGMPITLFFTCPQIHYIREVRKGEREREREREREV